MFTIYFFPSCNQKLLHNIPLLSEDTVNLTSHATTVKNDTVYLSHKVLQNCERLQTAAFSCWVRHPVCIDIQILLPHPAWHS